MTREAEIKTLMEADATLMAILDGGVYTEQEVGVEGFRRGEDSPTKDAFAPDGTLLTCALVREGTTAPMSGSRTAAGSMGLMQIVYIYFYEMRGKDQIVPAKDRTFEILNMQKLTRTYPITWNFETAPIPDAGPIMNSTALRQEWTVVSYRSVE